MARYALVTHWHLATAAERVFDALASPQQWPQWWRYVRSVELVEPGDAAGVGALRRFAWTSRLPYGLSFTMRTVALERPRVIEGVASGDLNGTGRWVVDTLGTGARARYEWTVDTGKGWMNRLAPMLAPVFAWNHDQVMAEGGRGLARHLGVELLALRGTRAVREREVRAPPMTRGTR